MPAISQPFENIIRDAARKNKTGIYKSIVMFGLPGLVSVFFGIAIPAIFILVLGSIAVLLAVLFAWFRNEVKGEEYWMDLITQRPEKIIWIKPIQVKHVAAYVITLYKEMNFELRDTEGRSLTVKCGSADDQSLFMEGLKRYLPHAHIGYDSNTELMYYGSRLKFIEMLKYKNKYRPVGSLENS